MLNIPERWAHLNDILDGASLNDSLNRLSRSEAEQIYRCQKLVKYLNESKDIRVFLNSSLAGEDWPTADSADFNKCIFVLDGANLLHTEFDAEPLNSQIGRLHKVLLVGLTDQYFIDTNSCKDYYLFNLRKCSGHLHLGLKPWRDLEDVFDLSINYIREPLNNGSI